MTRLWIRFAECKRKQFNSMQRQMRSGKKKKKNEIGVMNGGFTFTSPRTSAQLRFLVCCFSVCFLSGLGDDKPSNATTHKSSGPSTGLKLLIVLLGLVTVVAFSFFLFKLWQRKKRQEQQARFLKLFEDDDELEVELGIRD